MGKRSICNTGEWTTILQELSEAGDSALKLVHSLKQDKELAGQMTDNVFLSRFKDMLESRSDVLQRLLKSDNKATCSAAFREVVDASDFVEPCPDFKKALPSLEILDTIALIANVSTMDEIKKIQTTLGAQKVIYKNTKLALLRALTQMESAVSSVTKEEAVKAVADANRKASKIIDDDNAKRVASGNVTPPQVPHGLRSVVDARWNDVGVHSAFVVQGSLADMEPSDLKYACIVGAVFQEGCDGRDTLHTAVTKPEVRDAATKFAEKFTKKGKARGQIAAKFDGGEDIKNLLAECAIGESMFQHGWAQWQTEPTTVVALESAANTLVWYGRSTGSKTVPPSDFIGFETSCLPSLRYQIQGHSNFLYCNLGELMSTTPDYHGLGSSVDSFDNARLDLMMRDGGFQQNSIFTKLALRAGDVAYMPGGIIMIECAEQPKEGIVPPATGFEPVIGLKMTSPNFSESVDVMAAYELRMKLEGIKPDDPSNVLAVVHRVSTHEQQLTNAEEQKQLDEENLRTLPDPSAPEVLDLEGGNGSDEKTAIPNEAQQGVSTNMPKPATDEPVSTDKPVPTDEPVPIPVATGSDIPDEPVPTDDQDAKRKDVTNATGSDIPPKAAKTQ
jgi:negative regulator of replication initiation